MRNLFGAIEAGIRATAPRAALRGLLATLRAQRRATEAEIIERGKRRRSQRVEFRRAAQAAFAKQRRRAHRPQRARRRLRRVAWPR